MSLLLAACGGSSDSGSDALANITASSSRSAGQRVELSHSMDTQTANSSSSVSSSLSSASSSLVTDGDNTVSVANAGSDQSVATGTDVVLDGNDSSDADGDALSFSWELTSAPADSNAVLIYETTAEPSFTADVPGTFVATLIVNDGQNDSSATTVTVESAYQNFDITNIELNRRVGSCANYVGSYYSNVEDIQRAMAFEGNLTLTLDGDICHISSNEIPNHDFNDSSAYFATNVSAQVGGYTIPAYPQQSASVTDLSVGLKNIIFLNGVTADLLAAACYAVGSEPIGEEKIGCGQDNINNPWRYDPMSPLNTFGTDSHNAHPQPDGTYHYHGDPRALFDLECEASAVESPVIGFAADGFPVYGPCITDTGSVRKALSSYVLKNNGGLRQDVTGYQTPQGGVGGVASDNYDGQFVGDYEFEEGAGDLDQCNGMTVDGQYGYYITDAFPWIIGCFKGEPDESFRPTGTALQNLLHKHEDTWHSH
ncbi:YHYH protein [Gilvimarinus sp. SDUM040013]|nr:YHYH protein [Gilvimarinus sp. SDUM040013]